MVSRKPWFSFDVSWWPAVATALEESGREWPIEAACADLRWFSDQIRVRRQGRIPSRRRLSRRWSWGEKKVRLLLKAEHEWKDLYHDDVGPRRDRARAKGGPSRGPSARDDERVSGASGAQRGPGEGPSKAQEGPHARDPHRHPSQHPDTPGGGATTDTPEDDPLRSWRRPDDS